MPAFKKDRKLCRTCKKETARPSYTYCSNMCQKAYQYQIYIDRWKSGAETGLIALGVVSNHVKKYLREKYGNKCCICGWASINPITATVPLVADHIDGNWRNNTEDNLRLICPNCDSLTSTYAALNKGKGRPQRNLSYRYLTARNLYRKHIRP